MDRQKLAELITNASAEDFSTFDSGGYKPPIINPYNQPEFVGSYDIGRDLGVVIPNLDEALREELNLGPEYRAVGLLRGRVGALEIIRAVDEGVKSTNTKVAKVELCRDTMGGAGHGCTVVVAGENVADCRQAIEISLDWLPKTYGDVYVCDSGHIILHYIANAGEAVSFAFGAPLGKPFGMVVGAPAAIGMVMADTALKSGNIEKIAYMDAVDGGAKLTNEVILTFTGDAGAVKSATLAAREKGLGLLASWGEIPRSMTTPQIR